MQKYHDEPKQYKGYLKSALVPQQPDLYTRIHHRIVAAVLGVLPIDAVCSIDELAATVAPRDVPAALTHQIKQRLRDAVGAHITCSIGYAPNRWLAKIAADLDKPDGLTVLHPRDLPGRLLTLDLENLPGVATRWHCRGHSVGPSATAGSCPRGSVRRRPPGSWRGSWS